MNLPINSLVNLAIWIVILGVVFWLLLYLVNSLPGFAPYQQVGRVLITVIAVLVLILLLLKFAGLVTLAYLPADTTFAFVSAGVYNAGYDNTLRHIRDTRA